MSNSLDVEPSRPGDPTEPSARSSFGWKAACLTLALQFGALAAATYPSVFAMRSNLPGGFDSLQHLWVMRWYKARREP